MSLDILLHRTPPWVWALFAVLVYRGIRALRPRRMSVARTFLLPIPVSYTHLTLPTICSV